MVIKLRSGKLTRVMKEAGVEDAREVVAPKKAVKPRKAKKPVVKTSTKKAPKAKKTKEKSKCSSGMKFIGGKCRKVTEIIGREAK